MSRIALGRTFAKFNVSNIDPNYRGQIMIPVDSIVSISTFSSLDLTLHMRPIVTASKIYFKNSTNEVTHVIVDHSIDDIDKYLSSIE